jgi:hypothetical protein
MMLQLPTWPSHQYNARQHPSPLQQQRRLMAELIEAS